MDQLSGDPLRSIAKHLTNEADILCFRLASTTLCKHSDPPAACPRSAFLRTRARAVFACEQLRGFMLESTTKMLVLAAREGCVDVLAELVDARGCTGHDPRERACGAAASHGHLEVLCWLRGRGFPWSESVCCSAATAGHLEVLRYLHEHGCLWDRNTCHCAAHGGHVEVLRYAHEHGCPWDRNTCYLLDK